jgi:hypothetical protein
VQRDSLIDERRIGQEAQPEDHREGVLYMWRQDGDDNEQQSDVLRKEVRIDEQDETDGSSQHHFVGDVAKARPRAERSSPKEEQRSANGKEGQGVHNDGGRLAE